MPEMQRWQIAPNSGLGFAAPVEKILEALPDLRAGKSVERAAGAYLGISPDPQFALSDKAIVGGVEKGSPADQAGVRKGDRIARVDGREVRAWKDLLDVLEDREPGDALALELKRGEESIDAVATLGERK
jgi:S1-C subfamily serine protease